MIFPGTARWEKGPGGFGILGLSPSNNPFHKGIPGIQTTNPTTNLPIVDLQYTPPKKMENNNSKKHLNPNQYSVS